MSNGFQVVMSDLLAASATFHTESATLEGIMPDSGPACPDGGSAAINKNLQVVAEMIGTLHHQAAAVIDGDSEKLRTAHDRYANTEENLTQLSGQIGDPSKIN
jgi:hypothetical protein